MVQIELNVPQFILFFIPAFIGTFIGNSLGFLLPNGRGFKTKVMKAFIGTLVGFILGAVISVIFFNFWSKSKIIQKSKLKKIDVQKSPVVIKT